MAAHIKTVFEQVESGGVTPEQLKHGLSYAQFGDNVGFVSYDDWRALIAACDAGQETMLVKVHDLAPKYTEIWRMIGEPRTAEEWLERWVAWMKEELAR